MLDAFQPDRPDPMMQELRAIRDGLSEELSQLSREEVVRYFQRSTEEISDQLDCRIVADPSRPGSFRLLPNHG